IEVVARLVFEREDHVTAREQTFRLISDTRKGWKLDADDLLWVYGNEDHSWFLVGVLLCRRNHHDGAIAGNVNLNLIPVRWWSDQLWNSEGTSNVCIRAQLVRQILGIERHDRLFLNTLSKNVNNLEAELCILVHRLPITSLFKTRFKIPRRCFCHRTR